MLHIYIVKEIEVGVCMLHSLLKYVQTFYKQSFIFMIIIVILFTSIGIITTSKPSSRLASPVFSSWMVHIDQSLFSYLFGLENHEFSMINQHQKRDSTMLETIIQMITSVQMKEMKSMLGNEIPGFSTYQSNIVVASEDTVEIDPYSHESGPPLEIILKDREAVDEEMEGKEDKQQDAPPHTTEGKQVVFLYNSHNRESFLPHLPKETDTNSAYHKEVNITKVSERIAQKLEQNGIGSQVDNTDIMQVLHENDWKYKKSYDASRPVVKEAIANNKDIQYIFDIHRDSLPRDKTVKKIGDKNYSTILFVIGAEHKNYEKNLSLATELHYAIDEKYPGLSKGVITKEGANSNGIYNQDLSENAILMEIGGYENTLKEMYRSADVVAEIFSNMYWEAEKVSK